MKTIFTILALLVVLTSCQQLQVKPVPPAHRDTIPDGSGIKLKFMRDADTVYSDEVILAFSHAFSPAYVRGEDAPRFNGFGRIGSVLISADGISLTIDDTSAPGAAYEVFSVYAGSHTIKLSKIDLPASLRVWLKHGSDSTDLRQSPYDFTPGTDTGKFTIAVN